MRRWPASAAMAGIVLAIPVAVWCLLGDRSEPDGDLRMFEPPTIGRGLELAIGVTAAAVVLASLAVALHAFHAGFLDRRHRRATAPLVVAGVLLAAGGRIVTAATGGANIGGGVLILAAPIVIPPLVVLGVIRWWRIPSVDT